MYPTKKKLLQKAIEMYETRIEELKRDQDDLLHSIDGSAGTLDLDDQSHMDEASANVERENQQIAHAQKEISILNRVFDDPNQHEVDFGALVETDKLNFLIAVDFSRIKVDDKQYLGITVDAPIYKEMVGKKHNETFTFKNTTYKILNIR